MRLLIQTLLSLGILFLSPFAFPLLIAPIFPGYWRVLISGDLEATFNAVILTGGAYGMLALWASVVIPARFFSRHDVFRRLVIAGLAMGSIAVISLIVDVVPKHWSTHDHKRLLGDAWLYGGALTVAIWNIGRLWGDPNWVTPGE